MSEPIYGDRRKCPQCHGIVPDHFSWCELANAVDDAIKELRRKLRRRVRGEQR